MQGRLLRQEKVSIKEMMYLLSDYDIQDYGEAVFSDMPKAQNGEFRSCRSMIPFEYLDKRAKDFDWNIYGDDDQRVEEGRALANAFIVNFQKWRRKGKGLYIHSATKGTGKTYLAFCLANEVMERFDANVKFINTLDYIDLAKKGGGIADKEEKDRIVRATLLILDDIGVETSQWVNTALYQLLDYRYLNKLITIITSNYPLEQLKVDDRIKDRINDIAIPLHIPEVPVRAMKADKENSEFIHSVFET